jgi:cellobiose phosphorylase
MPSQKLWRFSDNLASFSSLRADKVKGLYFPLANEALMSSLSPDLHGDCKASQQEFLLEPASRSSLADSRSSRNFWVYLEREKTWSACGVSKDLAQIRGDTFRLEAGLLWHKIYRENRQIGLAAEILSFIPCGDTAAEVMQVTLTNISPKKITFIPFAAIPIYGRGAQNIRDHRHVSSLLQRIILDKHGVIVKPTLCFDEAGHQPNQAHYFVLGAEANGRPPEYIYPTQESFIGEAGDLEVPQAVLENLLPGQGNIQGKEAMGALRFAGATLLPRQGRTYIIVMGIAQEKSAVAKIFVQFNHTRKVCAALARTKDFWLALSRGICLFSADAELGNWLRWVNIQPVLRKIFGCSFLPDFDYGKGGRGWRDLWQDCLGLILNNPAQVRGLLVNNFSGVRIDGSNATIIGSRPGEFLSDRNNLSRVWMDHGVWPLLTLNLYLEETDDRAILFEKAAYFRDHQLCRSRQRDGQWSPAEGYKLKDCRGRNYRGTILEHLLAQNLAQFFNVGSHNHVRLEGADWNDGLDMAKERGESVAFSCMYAHNLKLLAGLLRGLGRRKIEVFRELQILLREFNYANIREKQKILEDYFVLTGAKLSGKTVLLNAAKLAENLERKAEWMARHIRGREWLKEGFFNGYYDNRKQRVEGRVKGVLRMSLAAQVFPLLSGVADTAQAQKIIANVEKYLCDKRLKGYRLNTDFKQEMHGLGRAFSFVYGEKENGAVFSHMAVIYAFALYQRGFVAEGWKALSSLARLALDSAQSKIYPCLPEYFNSEGRGMYSYLTGSASWFLLTLLTQAFGVRGRAGDLCIEPKLCRQQFRQSAVVGISRLFCGRRLQVNFHNPEKIDYPAYKILRAELDSRRLPLGNGRELLIKRKVISRLPVGKLHTIDIVLG